MSNFFSYAEVIDHEIINAPIDSVKPSPINDLIYGPIDPDSDSVQALALDIRDNGQHDPILLTREWEVISGHRRLAACKVLGFHVVRARFLDHIKAGSDEHRRMLVGANQQRVKTEDVVVREAAVLADPEIAHAQLVDARARERIRRDTGNQTEKINWIPRKRGRSKFSKEKRPMVDQAIRIIEELREFWPITVRQVHYCMLNSPVMRNTKDKTFYLNNKACYEDLTDVLARARIFGMVPWEAITDETRPYILETLWDSVGTYLKAASEQMFAGYSRSLLQTQPDFVVMVAEKLTVRRILAPICARFTMPLLFGRGYSDVGSIRNIAIAFNRSGKERLVILFVTDCDPEGESIPSTITSNLVMDLGLPRSQLDIRKVAITKNQATTLGLAPQMAKEESSRIDDYLEKHGTSNVWELEALTPAQLQQITIEAIESSIDVKAFNAEVDREKSDSSLLLTKAMQVRKFLSLPD